MDETRLPATIPDVVSTDLILQRATTDDILTRSRRLTRSGVLPDRLAAPMYALWEITGRCPLDCPFCYNDSPRRVRELDRATALRVADELVRMETFGVCLTGGEPTARRDLVEVIDRLRAGGVGVNMITSGWYVTPALAEQLSTRVTSVTVSLDASTPELHDAVRRRPGSFERAVRAIRLLSAAGCGDIQVATAVTPQAIADVPDIVNLCRSLPVQALRIQPVVLSGKALGDPHIAAARADYAALERRVREIARGLSGKPLLQWIDPSGHMRLGRELGRVVTLRITAEGHLGFCPFLPYVLGNVADTAIKECWDAGLCRAWRHPEVQRRLTGMESIHDLSRPGEDGREYVFLDPREALAECSTSTPV